MSLIILFLISQEVTVTYTDIAPFNDFYSSNRISSQACGRGYTGIANTGDLSSVLINPASLSLENKTNYYSEYIFKNTVGWHYDTYYDDIYSPYYPYFSDSVYINQEVDSPDVYLQELHPNFFAGHAFSINDFIQIGATYRVENSYAIVPNSTYYTSNFESSFKSCSFSVPITFNYRNLLRVGIDIIYLSFYIEQSYEHLEFDKIRAKFGAIYSPVENLFLGLTYLPGTKKTITVHYIGIDGFFSTVYGPIVFPLKIGAGICYKLTSIPLSFSADYNHSNTSEVENFVDRHDIHLGLEYDVNDNFTLRTGFFTQRDYRTIESQEDSKMKNFTQIFNTFGFSYKISPLKLNLSFMDSHLLSSGSVEQTYFSTGISYGF
jgi:long-subunit fatty acid transport protein